MVFIVNSTVTNLDYFVKATNLNIDVGKEEIKGRSLYLMGRSHSDGHITSCYSPFPAHMTAFVCLFVVCEQLPT